MSWHMTPRTRTERRFATRLRTHLDDQQVSVRELARRIAPDNLEPTRRRLNKYLAGEITPRPENRAEIAAHLGLEPDAFEDEEEESDPVLLLLNRIHRDLQDALIEAVRAAKAKAEVSPSQ